MAKKKTSPKAAAKRGRGRPATGHDKPFAIRATEAQRTRWKAAAEAAGQTLSDWVRQHLDQAAG